MQDVPLCGRCPCAACYLSPQQQRLKIAAAVKTVKIQQMLHCGNVAAVAIAVIVVAAMTRSKISDSDCCTGCRSGSQGGMAPVVDSVKADAWTVTTL